MEQQITQTPEEKQKNKELVSALLKAGLVGQAAKLVESYGIYSEEMACAYTEEWLGKFITQDKEMEKVKRKCRILSNTDDTVLIVGPSGTGKELLAKSLHGSRSDKFLSLNCGALPDELLESELFGSIKGSFTGSVTDKTGIFQAAKRGTVFLDEMGELPLIAQSALLRTLQENTIRKIGSNNEERIECRIVCATWHSLEEEVITKHFREDLYYRLSGIVLKTKSLRDRPEDIKLILGKLDTNKIIPEATFNEICNSYLLRGNVRELQAIVRRIELFGEES